MKPLDAAGKGIAAILELKEENEQLKRDLKSMTTSRNAAFDMIEDYSREKRELAMRIKHESEDYSVLAGLLLIVWLGFIGLVING